MENVCRSLKSTGLAKCAVRPLRPNRSPRNTARSAASKLASKRRNAEEEKRQRFAAIVSQIPNDRDYISIAEAVAMFCIGRDTLYRLTRAGSIPSINIGKRLIRISCSKLEEMFTRRATQRICAEKVL